MRECPFPAAPEIPVEAARCGMCGGDTSEPFAESYDYEYQTCRNLWRFVRCTVCENVYLNPRPARAALPVIYPKNYYAYNYKGTVNPLAYRVKAWLDSRTFSSIRSELTIPLQRYLDVGCGDGRYLKLLASQGVSRDNIFGIELDAALAERLRNDGFQMRDVPFEEVADLEEKTFQLITLFSVLEHLASPRDSLRRAARLLAPGGLVVFEVPNRRSLNARIFRDHYWGGYHTPRHWNLFSIDTVQRIVGDLGFRVKRMRRTTGHSFWLWSAHHVVRYRMGLDRAGQLLTPTKCLPGLAVVTPVDLVRAKLDHETDNMIVFLEKV